MSCVGADSCTNQVRCQILMRDLGGFVAAERVGEFVSVFSFGRFPQGGLFVLLPGGFTRNHRRHGRRLQVREAGVAPAAFVGNRALSGYLIREQASHVAATCTAPRLV